MNKEQGLQFLSELIDKINKQDNRCTAFPYFYVIKREKWRITQKGYGSGETRLVRVDFEGDPTVYLSKEEFVKDYIDREGYELTPPEPLSDDELEDGGAVSQYAAEVSAYNKERDALVDAANNAWDELEEFEEERYTEEENVFFTEEAYKEHVRLNGHNLERGCAEYYSYVKHAFRNPELRQLFEAIAAVTGKEYGKR